MKMVEISLKWLKTLWETQKLLITGHHDINEILLKAVLNTIQSIKSYSMSLPFFNNLSKAHQSQCHGIKLFIYSLPDDKFLDWFKLKTFADDKIKVNDE